MSEGTITKLFFDRGFGFIKSNGEQLFFHCTRLHPDLEFSERLLELRVKFDRIETPKGIEARNVQAAL